MEYTKGEWKSIGTTVYADNPTDIHAKIIIAEINPMGYNEESLANVRLIKKAPALCRMLEKALHYIEWSEMRQGNMIGKTDIEREIIEALKN